MFCPDIPEFNLIKSKEIDITASMPETSNYRMKIYQPPGIWMPIRMTILQFILTFREGMLDQIFWLCLWFEHNFN